MAKKETKKKKKKSDDTPTLGSQTVVHEIGVPEILPVLAAKDMVPFPGVMMSLYLSRAESIRALEASMDGERLAFVVAQLRPDVENPASKDLYKIGVVAHIVRTLQVQDGRHKVLLQGLVRARVKRFDSRADYLRAKIEPIGIDEETGKISAENQALINRIRENLQLLVEYEHLPEEMLIVTEELYDPGMLADVILAHYKVDLKEAQAALEELDPMKRLRLTSR
jgi:ATP-dependent Lon protease